MKMMRWKRSLLLLVLCLLATSHFAHAGEPPPASKTAASPEVKAKKATKAPVRAEKSEGTSKSSRTVSPDSEATAGKSLKKSPASSQSKSKNKSGTSERAGSLDASAYRVRLRDLEQRVDELKEQIRRSHTRLSLLSDTILSGAAGGARVEIDFVNDLSGAWHVVEAVFVLDGAVQYKRSDDTGALAKQKKIPIFSGTVPSGDHTLQVLLKLRGHGYGVFSYLRGIEAKVSSSHSFSLTDGKVLKLSATAWEQGGPTTPVEEQPAIRFQQTLKSRGGSRRWAREKKKKENSSSAESSSPKKSGGKKSSK